MKNIIKKTKYLIISTFLLLSILFNISPVFAWSIVDDGGLGKTGKETGHLDRDFSADSSRIMNTALSLLGIIFLILMMYGGLLWMSAQGNEAQIEKAKNVIKAGTIGIIVVLSAYAVSFFFISIFGKNYVNI